MLRMIRAGAALLSLAVLCAAAGAQTPALAPADSSALAPGFMVVDGDTLWVAAPLEVVGTRVPAALPGQLRPVGVVAADDLDELPAGSISDALAAAPGVVTGQRRTFGVQSDLSIRGSSFEQVQVLLDGNDMSDPQTGHHLLDLPLALQDIERLEVLPGHGSALYGSGAFGGTLNVVTRQPGDRTGGEVAVSGGGQGTRGARGAADVRLDEATGLRLSGSAFGTDGYDVPTAGGGKQWAGNDAEVYTATGRLVRNTDGGQWDAFAGYAAREFGALDFYAPYPSRERTRTFFAALKRNWSASRRLTLEPRLHFRRHTDRFILLKDDPEAFTNDHVTRRAAGELRGIVDLGRGHAAAWSLEGAYEDIDSRGLRAGAWGEALGFHVRRRMSLAVEVDRNRGPVRWQLGGRIDGRDAYAPRTTGTAALAWDPTRAWTVRGSMGGVFRVPTFTELYYVSPANVGNPGLKPEHGWTWDTGLGWHAGAMAARATYFERYEDDLIEWARPANAADNPWQVMNIATGKTRGTELRLDWTAPRGHSLGLSWSWLDKTTALPAGFMGKYTLLAPRQVLAARGNLVLPAGFGLGLTSRYIERTGGPAEFNTAFVLDGKLTWTRGDWFAHLTGTNLLDRSYQEVPGVYMSGPLAVVEVGRRF